MSNLFLHLEDHTGDYEEPALITEGDEGESVAAVIAELTEESAELAETEREIEEFQGDVETADELVEAVEEAPQMESAGLTTANARLLAKVLKSVGGQAYAAKHMPKLVHFEGRASRRDATALVMESVSDSLKNFWEALKKQLKAAADKIRSIYVKAFSGARRLGDKAEKVRDRAEATTGSIDKKTFEFGQVKTIAVGGQLKSTSDFDAGFATLVALVEDVNHVPNESVIKAIQSDLEKIDAEQGIPNAVEFNKIITASIDGFKSIGTEEIKDASVKASLGATEGGNTSVKATPVLPGNKQFAVVTSKEGADLATALRLTRLAIVSADSKAKEPVKEVITLNASQGAKYASQIADIASTIYDYEKQFAKVEAAEQNVIKALDTLFASAEKVAKEAQGSDKALRDMRSVATAATTAVRRISGTPAQVNQYALSVFDATLNWVEGSLRQHKAA